MRWRFPSKGCGRLMVLRLIMTVDARSRGDRARSGRLAISKEKAHEAGRRIKPGEGWSFRGRDNHLGLGRRQRGPAREVVSDNGSCRWSVRRSGTESGKGNGGVFAAASRRTQESRSDSRAPRRGDEPVVALWRKKRGVDECGTRRPRQGSRFPAAGDPGLVGERATRWGGRHARRFRERGAGGPVRADPSSYHAGGAFSGAFTGGAPARPRRFASGGSGSILRSANASVRSTPGGHTASGDEAARRR